MPGVDQIDLRLASATSTALDVAHHNGFVQRYASVAASYDNDELPHEIHSRREEDSLIFEDSSVTDRMFGRLRTMRTNREFCDVILEVGRQELYAHRVVLAAASPYLYELFTQANLDHAQTNDVSKPHENGHSNGAVAQPEIARFDLHHFAPEEFELLIAYAYTSTLIASPNQVTTLYRIATQLRMRSCAQACAKYLAERLCVENAIGLRACTNSTRDIYLTEEVDRFIQGHFRELAANSKEFATLQCIQADLAVPDARPLPEPWRLSYRVLQHIKAIGHASGSVTPSIDPTTTDNLRFYQIKYDETSESSEPDDHPSRVDVRTGSMEFTSKRHVSASKSSDFDGSTESLSHEDEVAWRMIAAQRLSEHNYLALVVADCRLCSLSIRVQRPSIPADEQHGNFATEESYLSRMSDRRCSAAAITFNGKIVVCGGYDRGRCLDTVEEYNPQNNEWACLAPMGTRRGRLSAVVWNERILAVCGSDGAKDLSSVEIWEPDSRTWQHFADCPQARSNLSSCVIGDSLYIIGGWNGQTVFKDVDVLDLKTGQWSQAAPLPDGRTNAACIVHDGKLLLAGGSNRYGCVNGVFQYEPQTNAWTELPKFSVARRGCGAAVMNNKLFVIGGADGTSSLNSVEILDFTTMQWTIGPSLNVARTNVDVTCVQKGEGCAIYAVGGFSGKSFLNSMELLGSDSEAWHYRFE